MQLQNDASSTSQLQQTSAIYLAPAASIKAKKLLSDSKPVPLYSCGKPAHLTVNTINLLQPTSQVKQASSLTSSNPVGLQADCSNCKLQTKSSCSKLLHLYYQPCTVASCGTPLYLLASCSKLCDTFH